MREYIAKRQKEHSAHIVGDELFVMSCTIFEKMVTEKGFGLAGENSKESWVTRKLTANLSLELVEDVRHAMGERSLLDEVINVLCHEAENDLNEAGFKNIAFFRLVKEEIENGQGQKVQRVTVKVGCC